MPRRRFRRWPSRGALLATCGVFLIGVRWLLGDAGRGLPPEPQHITAGAVRVERVVDGDTLVVRPVTEISETRPSELRVRLLGIDTPETVKPHHAVDRFGPEASAYMHARVEQHEVRLEFDHRRIDRYGRVLAYVWLDDTLVNEELVRQGLARVAFFPGDSTTMRTRFLKAEEAARSERRGIWSSAGEAN